MITTYIQLLPMVVPELRNCPEPIVLQALERAGRVFCTSTRVWVKELGAIDVVADQAQYPLEPGETVVEGEVQPDVRLIEWVTLRGGYVNPDHYTLVLDTSGEVGAPTFALEFKEDYVPGDSTTDGLVAQVVLVPNRLSGYMSSFVLDAYGDCLASGALAYLLGMSGKPWADLERARDHADIWAAGLSMAVSEKHVGRKTGSLRVNLDLVPWE